VTVQHVVHAYTEGCALGQARVDVKAQRPPGRGAIGGGLREVVRGTRAVVLRPFPCAPPHVGIESQPFTGPLGREQTKGRRNVGQRAAIGVPATGDVEGGPHAPAVGDPIMGLPLPPTQGGPADVGIDLDPVGVAFHHEGLDAFATRTDQGGIHRLDGIPEQGGKGAAPQNEPLVDGAPMAPELGTVQPFRTQAVCGNHRVPVLGAHLAHVVDIRVAEGRSEYGVGTPTAVALPPDGGAAR